MLTARHDTAEVASAVAQRPAEGPDAALRTAGLRVTAPRRAVLAAIAARQHVDADTIAAEVRERLGTVSKQTVYDVLHALTRAGLVRRIAVDDGRARFELHRHDNHHHLVCRACGRIEDVECAVGASPCLDPAGAHGFVVDQAEVTFRGLCAACAGPVGAAPTAPAVV